METGTEYSEPKQDGEVKGKRVGKIGGRNKEKQCWIK